MYTSQEQLYKVFHIEKTWHIWEREQLSLSKQLNNKKKLQQFFIPNDTFQYRFY